MMKLWWLFLLSTACMAQTTVTIPSTVTTAGIDRPGINLGGLAYYGPQQLLKSLNYASGGYMPGQYFATTFSCSSGGTQSTTNWYNNITNGTGFPANFWAGATFVAINAASGTSYGSGTVTASTSNVSAGANFTLSPAISSACSPSNNDVIVVRLNAQNTLEPPTFDQRVCAGATWNTSDTSPSSTNTQQSLEMPSTCTLTYYLDATMANATNTNGYASSNVNFINLNGSYNATFKAKCAVSGCSLNFSLGRIGGTSFVSSTNVSPSYSATNGAGWTTYTYPFTGTETGSQASDIEYAFTCTGTCLIQDVDVIEGSTLAGNTSPFRDAVVWELEQIHPGSIRYMDTSQWCSYVADQIAATGNRRWCGASSYLPQGAGTPLGYNDVLSLGNVVGSDVLLSVGQLNGPSDWTTLINWLNSSGWISTYSAAGHKIFLEDGNEAWNTVPASIWNGNGIAYGYTLGLNMAAAKAASGYNSSVIKLVGNSWNAGDQGYGQYGWVHNALSTASSLPNYVDVAPYMLNYLGAFATSGSNVSTTGAPFLDEWAEDANIDSVTSPPANSTSMYENASYVQSTFSVGTVVYEVNESTLSGITASQLQLNQISGSVGNALGTMEHVLLMQRDSGVTGPIHVFTLADPFSAYSCGGCGSLQTPLWGANLFMATGPGQTAGTANSDRPLAIAERIINNAIGSNSNLITTSQSGTPTFSYTADQNQSGTPTILANSAVPYVNCIAYANTAQTNWTAICFNNNLSSTESVSFTGAGAPSGTVAETLFGNSNNITDNNENTFLGAGSISPVVAVPTATSTSGTSYTIPAASMMVLTYGTGSASYFMSTTGSDSNNGSNNTTQAWASPNHALNCGDTITASAGSYNANSFAFGTVTCSAGNNVAWLQCATAFACTSTISSGGQYAAGIQIGNSYWGVQGWVISTGSGEGGCFFVYPNTSTTTIHHIIFANNIADGCGKAGFEASTNGSAGVDYFTVVGNIAYKAAAGSSLCESGINQFNPTASDSLPGTHDYYAGNFSFDNVNPIPCNGNTPSTDGEGLFFDTVQPYTQQLVIDNNISAFNGGNGLKVYNNTTGTPNAKLYFRHNTVYGNETGGVNGGTCSEIGLQSAYSTEVYLNIAETTAATACNGAQTYYAYGGVTVNSTDIYWNNYGYSAAGNNLSASGAGNVNNTFANPSLASPANPSAPSCGSFSTTTACMATVIANFKPTATAALAFGYQAPSTTSIYDPLYPQWLCNVNLPAGLVTPGCLTASSLSGATLLGAKVQ
jgi:hypothetical protein